MAFLSSICAGSITWGDTIASIVVFSLDDLQAYPCGPPRRWDSYIYSALCVRSTVKWQRVGPSQPGKMGPFRQASH